MPVRISLTIAILLELVLFYNFCTRLVSLSETQKRIDVARAARTSIQMEYEAKANELEYVRTDSYVEDIARRKLRYGRPEDHIYILPSTKEIGVTLEDIRFEEVTFQQQLTGQLIKWFELFFK
jgi:cell division protein FtsB